HGVGYFPALLDETAGSINHSQMQTQHQPLIVTEVRHRLSCLPIRQFPMLFNKDVKTYSGMKGIPSVSKLPLRRVVPDCISVKSLELNRSAYSAHTAYQQNIRPKRTLQSNRVSLEYYIPEKPNTTGTLRSNRKTYAIPGLAVLETEQSSEVEQLSKQETGDYSFFPDLENIDQPGKSLRFSNQLGALRLEMFPGEQEDAASSGSWSSE
ncbi:cytosolic carboxypeptidase 2 isoform X1, partial [Clarias magur]